MNLNSDYYKNQKQKRKEKKIGAENPGSSNILGVLLFFDSEIEPAERRRGRAGG